MLNDNELFFKISLPSFEIDFSQQLLHAMKFDRNSCPKTLEQYLELWHPQDISKVVEFQKFVSANHDANFLNLTRKLYCGDGIYRTFQLNAFVNRNLSGEIAEIICREFSELQIWLQDSSDGDRFTLKRENFPERTFEAISIQGVKFLRDIGEILELEQENCRLRRELQKRIFSAKVSAIFGEWERDVKIGIVGLTCSGKSSFVNAILGERIIPEHAEIQTQTAILCKNGDHREAKIFHKDTQFETVRDSDLTADYLRKISSSLFAPGNIPENFRIELTIPGALIPENVSIIDTPAFVPFEQNLRRRTSKSKKIFQANDLLRKLLPKLDAIIYILPLRFGLQSGDFEFLHELENLNKRIIFLLSFSDLESHDFDAGNVSATSREKIMYSVEKFRTQLRNYFPDSEPDFDVLPVSSKFALERFYDRQSLDWKNSNFELVFNLIRGLLENNPGSISYEFPENPAILKNKSESQNILSSLINSMRELEFRNEFFGLKSFKTNSKLVLLSPDRDESLRLFAKLAHNNKLARLPEGYVSACDWLYSGSIMPLPCVKLPDTGMNDDILIAPSDEFLPENIFWENLFRQRVPVISVNLLRYDSGFHDLTNAPYFQALKNFRCVIIFGNGIYFENETRNSNRDFKRDVIKNIELFSRRNSLKKSDIFMYEDYDIILCRSV